MDDRTAALSGRRVLVTGGTGFIGSKLVEALVRIGADVHVLSSADRGTQSGRRPVPDDVGLHRGDLRDRESIDLVVRAVRPDIVFHLGAYTVVGTSWSDPAECVRVNVEGTVNLLEALDEPGYDRLVHASTSEVYGNSAVPFTESAIPRPASPYAISKRAAEMLCQLGADHLSRPIVQLRLFNAYGPGQAPDRIVPQIISSALESTDLRMTRGTQTREFNHVLDLVEGLLLAAVVEGIEGELMNLGSGHEISIAELATTLLDLMGNPIRAQLGALPERPVEIRRMFCDPTRARRLLGWSPSRSLRDGLAETIEWYATQADAQQPTRSAEPS